MTAPQHPLDEAQHPLDEAQHPLDEAQRGRHRHAEQHRPREKLIVGLPAAYARIRR
ncbi:hypothetical protein ACN27F_32655 [Solwaraspora sp. WMMB335]|uniref:hypothetical protein n=1 Tax=Solwaraspora sp. WMMB335 TaxID=3404118 RepID=UPI003B92A4B7